MASPPARWHHAPVHGQPEPLSWEKNSHRTSRRRHKLSPPPKQAGGEIPSDRIGRPVAPHHDVVGLDFPHAILVCWGALGGFCTRVLQAAAPPAWPRAASTRCRHHTLPPRIMTLMAVDWTSPSSCQKKPPHRRRRVLSPKASCAQPAATHFAAVSQASRRPSRTRLVPVRLAEGEIERDVASRPSVQLPSSSSLVSFGTSSCAGVLRLSQVHFSERIGAKARSRRRPPAAKQGSAKTCKSQTCPCHSPSPSILGSLRLSVSLRSHSAILKKKKKNRCNLRLATPFFWHFPENCLPSLLD